MGKKRIVNLADYGIIPDNNDNFAAAFNKHLENDNAKCSTYFRFVKGTYRLRASDSTKAKYSMSSTDIFPFRNLACVIKDKKDIVIDGDGSKFIFYGSCLPFTFDGCENVTLKNVVIDWEKPFVAEGRLVDRSVDYIDVKIDTNLFPCEVRNFCLYFDIGDGEETQLTYGKHTVYDSSSLTVSTGYADNIMINNAEALGDDVFRLYLSGIIREDEAPRKGDIIVLRHGRRLHSGIFAQNCKNIELENVKIHSCGGIGAIFQYCENVKINKVDFVPNIKAGRIVSNIRDDGICISSCTGNVEIANSTFYGCQDSSINVHGMGASVIALLDDKTVQCTFVAGYDNYPIWAKVGDRVAFVDKTTLRTLCVREVTDFRSLDDRIFVITFDESVPRELYDFGIQQITLDNLSTFPSVHIHDNFFGSTRSRGVLVTTTEKVVIEKNVFESAGAAILISGDMNLWFETGSSRDVTIRNNIFTDYCTLSEYFDSYAMISVCPQVAKPTRGIYYHKNILVENNTFISPDTPVFYAFNTENVVFKGNEIIYSNRRGIEHTLKNLISLKNCNNVRVYENSFAGSFSLDRMKAENCTEVYTKAEAVKE